MFVPRLTAQDVRNKILLKCLEIHIHTDTNIVMKMNIKNSLVQVIRFLQHGCKELHVSISEASMTLRSLKNSVKIRHLWSRSLVQFHDHWCIIASLNCYLQQIITKKSVLNLGIIISLDTFPRKSSFSFNMRKIQFLIPLIDLMHTMKKNIFF